MSDYDIQSVLEWAEILKREYLSKDDVDIFNDAIINLRDAVAELECIDSFMEIEK